MSLKDVANNTIKQPYYRKVLKYPDGRTTDIISVIFATAPISLDSVKEFAPALWANNKSVYHTCYRLWHFLKNNVSYQPDPPGQQFIKTPAWTWQLKSGDCKSYSLFISACLKILDIQHKFRFVKFNDSTLFTHVYIVVPANGKEIIMDVVMPQFNKEKPYTNKKDYDMAKIYQLSGIGTSSSTGKILFSLGNRDVADITEGEMELLIARDRLLTEKNIVDKLRGIGSLKAEKYQDSIDMFTDALQAADDYKKGKIKDIDYELDLISEDALNGAYSIAEEIVGIGSTASRKQKRKAKSQARKEMRDIKKTGQKEETKIRKELKKEAKTLKGGEKKELKKFIRKTMPGKTLSLLKKAGKAIKTGAKAVAKVVTAPARLAAKGILEITLPKAAPYFLYLFITDPEMIKKLPVKVQKKREKQENIANFIVNGIGMKRTHFMGICRNGIMKKYGKSPEKVIEEHLNAASGKKSPVSGIGRYNPISGIGIGAINSVSEIIEILHTSFSVPLVMVSENDAPVASDWRDYAKESQKKLIQDLKPKKPEQLINKIPETASYFLYLFINDPKIIEKLPTKIRDKRKKQEVVAEYIVSKLGVSRNQFMNLLRNGIQKKLNNSPENILKAYMEGRISGIGQLAIGAAAIQALISIIQKIASFIKGKKEKLDVSNADSPDSSDWEGVETTLFQKIKNALKKKVEENTSDVTKQPLLTTEEPETDLEQEFQNGGQSIWNTLKA